MALWLKNTNYRKEHGLCLLGLDVEAYVQKVKLFQKRTVFELLWGYTDPFLEFLKNPPPGCPGQKGLSSFVQLQVCGGVKKKTNMFKYYHLFCCVYKKPRGYTSYNGLCGEVKGVPFPGFRT